MDARALVWSVAILLSWVAHGYSQYVQVTQPVPNRRFVAETTHFRVFASDPGLAQEVGQMAEEFRKHLALHWLAKELPPWIDKVPVVVQSAPNMPASGETKYTLVGGTVRNFQMLLCGSRERILDSVLPHEMTHTILASHFAASGKPVPRWADEGACTTVEDASERSKHDTMLVRFLSENRGIPFKLLFAMRDYPSDMMPLYAQGYSLCAFLIAQGGPRQFIHFLERGMRDEDWVSAVAECYGYPKLGKLQVAWNTWVSDGGGSVANYTAMALGHSTSTPAFMASSPTSIADTNSQIAMGGNRTMGLNADGSVAVNNPKSLAMQGSMTRVAGSKGDGYYQQQFQRLNNGQASTGSWGGQTAATTNNDALAANSLSTLPPPSITYSDGRVIPLPSGNGQLPLGGVPVQASQPAPMQTLGGTIYR